MECREGCGACCIALSITSALPGAPDGKPAGMVCPHLSSDKRCRIYDDPGRPQVCASLKPSPDLCGASFEEAMALIATMEIETTPST